MYRETALSREFGYRIKRRRMALGLSQKALGERTNYPQGHVSRLERGEFNFIHLAKLVALADALATSLDFLLARSDDAGEVPAERSTVSCTYGHVRHHGWCIGCRALATEDVA